MAHSPHAVHSLKMWGTLFHHFGVPKPLFSCTGKSFSEVLILASTNPQYDKTFEKIVHGNFMNNLMSYSGLFDAKIRASDKDLPVSVTLWYRKPWPRYTIVMERCSTGQRFIQKEVIEEVQNPYFST